MDRNEVDTYVDRLEHGNNIQIAYAVAGCIEPDSLDEDARETYEEFMMWSRDRTRQVRSEEIAARYAEKETRRANKMVELREKGIITEETLLLYGISGPLPDREVYAQMSDVEKEHLWEERMVRRFGDNWRARLNINPRFLRRKCEKITHDWLKEGF